MKNVRRQMLTLIIALIVCAALLVQVAGVGAKADSSNLLPGDQLGRASSPLLQDSTASPPSTPLAAPTLSDSAQGMFGLGAGMAPASTVQTVTVNGDRGAGNELFVADLQAGDRIAFNDVQGQVTFDTLPPLTCTGLPYTAGTPGLNRAFYWDPNNASCYRIDRQFVDPLPNDGHAGLFVKIGSTRIPFLDFVFSNFVANANEPFSLGINDGYGINNGGSFSLRVTITHASPVFVPGSAIAGAEQFVADLKAGDQVNINGISGQVTFNTSNQTIGCNYKVDARGLARNVYDDPQNADRCYSPDHGCNDPLRSSGHAGLYLKRGNNRTFIGTAGASFTANGNETLSLGINDCPATNNTGGFNVPVIISRARPKLSINDVTVTEGSNGPVEARFTVTLSQASTERVTVNYSISNGTTSAEDYNVFMAPPPIIFEAGQTSQPIVVDVTGDTLVEPTETFKVNLTNVSLNATFADDQGIGTILNDDVPISFVFTETNHNVIENSSGGTVTVQRIGGSAGTVRVNYATSDGSARAGSDYTAKQGTLVFDDGERYQDIFIPLFNDTLDEPNETLTITLNSPTGGATLGSPSTLVITIVDNDPAPTISINDVSVTEGDSNFITAVFTVRLSFAYVSAVTVHYKTASGTATSGTDFGGDENNLTFSPGSTTQTITVKVISDNVVEPNETFYVNLTSPFNATLADGQGVGTINNDDVGGTLKFSAAAYSVNENVASVPITVTRTGGSGGTVTVQYATSNGTAAAGADYTAISNTLTFANGVTSQTFNVQLLDDALDETNETVNLSLSNPTGGATLNSPARLS